MPVRIRNIENKADYQVTKSIQDVATHANWLEEQVVQVQGRVASMPAPLTLDQIQKALSAGGSHALNLTGLQGTPGDSGTTTGGGGNNPPIPPVGPCGPRTDHADTVATAKAQLIAEGVDISGTCGSFAIVNRTVQLLQASGEAAGFIRKLTGNNCDGHSYNRIGYADLSNYQVLTSAGTANDPVWIYTGQLTDPADYQGPACP